jgi:hypothetical protein
MSFFTKAKHPESDDAAVDIEAMSEIGRVHGVPPPLVKAWTDPFEYAVGLRDGTIIHFESCEFDADFVFVRFVGIRSARAHGVDMTFSFERGLVARVADVAWAADAPNGS